MKIHALTLHVEDDGALLTAAITWRYERERTTLHQIIGRYQQAMEQQREIPEEEM